MKTKPSIAAPVSFHINRRQFLQTATAATALAALPSWGADALDLVNGKPKRVELIGAGWYGKSDLWGLVQVAPVEIVSICDPDKKMLAGAVEIAQQRQKSRKAPRTHTDYREMLRERDLDIVLIGSPDHWHALHCIAAMEGGAESTARSRPAATCARARRCSMRRENTNAWFRSARSERARRI